MSCASMACARLRFGSRRSNACASRRQSLAVAETKGQRRIRVSIKRDVLLGTSRRDGSALRKAKRSESAITNCATSDARYQCLKIWGVALKILVVTQKDVNDERLLGVTPSYD